MANICYGAGNGTWCAYNSAIGYEVWEETSVARLLYRILCLQYMGSCQSFVHLLAPGTLLCYLGR
jgi:hypothetical protein